MWSNVLVTAVVPLQVFTGLLTKASSLLQASGGSDSSVNDLAIAWVHFPTLCSRNNQRLQCCKLWWCIMIASDCPVKVCVCTYRYLMVVLVWGVPSLGALSVVVSSSVRAWRQYVKAAVEEYEPQHRAGMFGLVHCRKGVATSCKLQGPHRLSGVALFRSRPREPTTTEGCRARKGSW
jgi:hypothetical protein